MDVSGASTIITGGASGLGEACARQLAALGAHCVIVDLNELEINPASIRIAGITENFAEVDLIGQSVEESGVFGTIVALGYGYLASLFVLRLRFEMAALHAMGLPQASLAIDGNGFTVASGAGRASLPWRSVQEVWCYADFWLLFFSASQFMILPTSDLPEAMQAAIREQVRQHGGRLL